MARLDEGAPLGPGVERERVAQLDEVGVRAVLVAQEVQAALLHPAAPGGFGDGVRKAEHGVVGGQDPHRRVLVGHPVAADPRRVGPVLRLVELELVVLHDQRAAGLDVLEQPVVVRAQVPVPLVGSDSGHDHVVPGQVAEHQRVAGDVLEPRAELLDGRRHFVADPVDVTDPQVRVKPHVEDLDGRLGGVDEVPPADVGIFHHLVAAVEPRAPGLEAGADAVVADGRVGGRPDRETDGPRFVLAGEGHRYPLGRALPARGEVQADDAAGGPGAPVADGDPDVAGLGRADGGDGHLRGDLDRERRHDVQFHALLARERVAAVAEGDRPVDGDGGGPEVELETGAERRGAERRAERHVRVEPVARRVGQPLPVHVGRGRVGRQSQRGLAAVHRAGGEGARPAPRIGGLEAVEPDPLDGDRGPAVVGRVRQHRDRLPRGHDAVVGEDVEPQVVGQHHRPFVLGLLLRQPEIDLVDRLVRQAESGQIAPQVADGPEPRQQGHPLCFDSAPLVDLPGRGGVAGEGGEALREAGRRFRPGMAGQPLDRRVDPVEQRTLDPLGLTGDDRLVEPEADRGRPRQHDERRHALALVHAAGLAADLGVGAAEQRVEPAEVDGDGACPGVVRAGAAPSARPAAGVPPEPAAEAEGREAVAEVELPRLPRAQPLGQMLGEPRGVGGRRIRFAGQQRRRLMVLPAARSAGAHGRDHVGPQGADQAHQVVQDRVAPPLVERLFAAERVAEVDGAGEELLGPVQAVRGQRFFGPQHGQGVEQLGADLVLPAFAAGGGDEGGAHPLAVAQQRQQPVDLVVGMRGDRRERPDVVELAQHQSELGAAVDRLRRLRLRGRPRRDQGNEQGSARRRCAHLCHGHDLSSIPPWAGQSVAAAGPRASTSA